MRVDEARDEETSVSVGWEPGFVEDSGRVVWLDDGNLSLSDVNIVRSVDHMLAVKVFDVHNNDLRHVWHEVEVRHTLHSGHDSIGADWLFESCKRRK